MFRSEMLGAVHWGVLAAVVVLLVPMGMAGWHLSRHKMLFCSGALFIALAVCVHLTSYFPFSVSEFVSSVQSVVVFDNRDSCIDLVNDIMWDVKPSSSDSSSSSFTAYDKKWTWSESGKVSACEFQKLSRSDASDLLNGSWVVVAGDSQARLITQSLLNLVLDSKKMESIEEDLLKRHSDYKVFVDEFGMKLDYIWAPFESNLTDLVTGIKQNRSYPDVLVMGSGLWHMLHVNNASDYGVTLQLLRSSVVSMLPLSTELGTGGSVEGSVTIRSPHLFWLGMPLLINGMLNTDEKRNKMNDDLWQAYNRALRDSRLLHKSGGPLMLLDIQSLTWNCGPHCTADGMHYDAAVYDAAVHAILNALLIQSHQKISVTKV